MSSPLHRPIPRERVLVLLLPVASILPHAPITLAVRSTPLDQPNLDASPQSDPLVLPSCQAPLTSSTDTSRAFPRPLDLNPLLLDQFHADLQPLLTPSLFLLTEHNFIHFGSVVQTS